MIRRRSVIIGMCSLVAAPAIVRADSLMRLTRPTRCRRSSVFLPRRSHCCFPSAVGAQTKGQYRSICPVPGERHGSRERTARAAQSDLPGVSANDYYLRTAGRADW
jgi:hypothetical protein